MGASYYVFPVSDAEGDLTAWLQELGVSPPGAEGRDPTIEELRAVLDHLDGYTINYHSGGKRWHADVYRDDTDWASLRVADYSGNDMEPHTFYFERGDRSLMLLILQCLAAACGPQLLFPSSGHLPVVVTPELDLDQALQVWDG